MMAVMNSFRSDRREILRVGALGLGAVVGSVIPDAHAAPHASAASGMPGVFDVRTYGAVGDGKTIDSPAINKAIEAAAAAGGGTVVFPPGNWLSFSILMKSHVGLYLSQAATIIAADSPLPGQTTGYNGGTYDAAEPNVPWEDYQDYGHNHWHNSLIWGEGLTDISITGPGTIYGKGLSFGANRTARGNYPIYVAEQAGVGNKAIALKNCHNVLLRDFSILKGGHFGLLLTGVDNLTIDNLKIDTDRDGMDIDCCKNVRVSNCTVNSPWDDAIVPKASFALGYNRACDNINITNCFVSGCYTLGSVLDGTWKKFTMETDRKVGGTGRIKFGTESNGGFRNISISNCVFEGCQGLAMETVDGALLEDITVTNITMRDIISCPIFLRLGARLRGPKGAEGTDQSTVVGSLKRVLISNVNCYNSAARFGSNITGIPNYYVEDLKISDVYVQHAGGGTADMLKIVVPEKENTYPEPGMLGTLPAHGFYFRHVKRLEMSHVDIEPAAPDARPAIYTDDVHRADFFAITAPSSPPAFSFNNSTDIRVLWSRAGADQTIA
jgi:polygalacturonase